MAQGALFLSSSNGTSSPSLSTHEIREIEECEKIINFCDEVLAGKHPIVKIPAHLLSAQKQGGTNTEASDLSSVSAGQITNKLTQKRALEQPITTTNGSIEATQAALNEEVTTVTKAADSKTADALPDAAGPECVSAVARSLGLESNDIDPQSARLEQTSSAPKHTRSEINPILLEKSDYLIKAEMQLQRLRLERALREQLEHHNASKKALLQSSESLPNFDISQVLAKALEKVPPSALVEAELSAHVATPASDSFDENTFYSSQHDTPEPDSPPHNQKGAVNQSKTIESIDRQADMHSTQSHGLYHDVDMTGTPTDASHSQSQRRHSNPQIECMTQKRDVALENTTSTNRIGRVSKPIQDPHLRQANLDARSSEIHVPLTANGSTLVHSHDLSPVAPQPSKVSPLIRARASTMEVSPADPAVTAQISVLRNQASGVSSTDSSPHGVKTSEKKKERKKNKRIGPNRDNVDGQEPVHIKTEPNSLSPYETAPRPEPRRDQRLADIRGTELNYDESRYETSARPHKQLLAQMQDGRPQARYDRYEVAHHPSSSFRGYALNNGEFRRISDQYARLPLSPREYALPYSPNETRPSRASSHTFGERYVHEEPRYYRASQGLPRASIRPDADRERSRSPIARERSVMPMAPPRQPIRIIVDAYGRQFIDRTSAPLMRQSLAPTLRPPESEDIYERTPIRRVSGKLPTEVIEEDAMIYRRASPSISESRRVVTQPEFSLPDYGSYRQREYSVRPHNEDYVNLRDVPERRLVSHFEELPRGYVMRDSSIRPDASGYESTREYAPRLSSVRPEHPSREYAASMRPEAHETVVPARREYREYSVRPTEMPASREYMLGNDPRRMERRRPTDIAFVEHPRQREASVVVYADDVRRDTREMYR